MAQPLDTFVGARKPLDLLDVPRLAFRLGCGEDFLAAFLDVESASRGFDREGRPTMLFEPHIFYRLLGAGDKRTQAEQHGLAYKSWRSGYPLDSYPRLAKAMLIDENAALQACSIGLSQVLVRNFSNVGYRSPQEMWRAFMDDEQEHVEAMVRFMFNAGIADDLKRLSDLGRPVTPDECRPIVAVYNGSGYERNNYHTKLAERINQRLKIADIDWAPDAPDGASPAIREHDAVKSVQAKLHALGYTEVGHADGAWGQRTRAAVLAFRADQGLPLIAEIDREVLAALMTASPRRESASRVHTSTKDLREAGSRQIKAADATQGAAAAVGGGGLLVSTAKFFGVDADTTGGVTLDSVQGVAQSVKTFALSLGDLAIPALVALAGFVVWQQVKIKRLRVQDARDGKHLGR
jgi:hypothetical protein